MTTTPAIGVAPGAGAALSTASRRRTVPRWAHPARDGTTVQDLLHRRAALPEGDPGRAALRARGIVAGLPLARGLAAAYQGRGEPMDDLYQVAAVALIRSVDGYDPERQSEFTSYAVPTIVGAIKRHFRDGTWRIRVPRQIQELAIGLAAASAELTQRLGRSPTIGEIADQLGVANRDVSVALQARQGYRPDSLDSPPAGRGDDRQSIIDTLGAADIRFDAVTDRTALRPLLAALPERQRRILAMRFFDDLSQAEIAVRVGLSQMQISRLLVRTLAELRAGMLADDDAPSGPCQR